MSERNGIDRLLASELSGSDKIYALLRARGYTYASFAREHGFWPEQVKLAVYGDRPYPQIRDAIAKTLGLDRAEIDRLLDDGGETRSAASEEAA